MASAGSGDCSNLTSSDSGYIARFDEGFPIGDESFAAPSIVSGPELELQAIEDADECPGFAEPCVIVDTVMASLASSLTASKLVGVEEEVQITTACDRGQAGSLDAKHSAVESNKEERD